MSKKNFETESWHNFVFFGFYLELKKDEKNHHHHIHWTSWELQHAKEHCHWKFFRWKSREKLDMTCRIDWRFFLLNVLRLTRLVRFGRTSGRTSKSSADMSLLTSFTSLVRQTHNLQKIFASTYKTCKIMSHLVRLVRLASFQINLVRFRKISPIGRLG